MKMRYVLWLLMLIGWCPTLAQAQLEIEILRYSTQGTTIDFWAGWLAEQQITPETCTEKTERVFQRHLIDTGFLQTWNQCQDSFFFEQTQFGLRLNMYLADANQQPSSWVIIFDELARWTATYIVIPIHVDTNYPTHDNARLHQLYDYLTEIGTIATGTPQMPDSQERLDNRFLYTWTSRLTCDRCRIYAMYNPSLDQLHVLLMRI